MLNTKNPLTALVLIAITEPKRLKPIVQEAYRQSAGLVLREAGEALIRGDSQPPSSRPTTGSGRKQS